MKNYERYPVGWCLSIYITARLMRASWQLAENSKSWSREACCNAQVLKLLHDAHHMLQACKLQVQKMCETIESQARPSSNNNESESEQND